MNYATKKYRHDLNRAVASLTEHTQNSGRPCPFVDNRPEAIQLRKLQSLRNLVGVIQFDRGIAERNWGTINGYGGNQAEDVRDAFQKANYTRAEMDAIIITQMDRGGFGKQLFAHGSGNSDSGRQGDTNPRIAACVQYLIQWAAKYPKHEKEKPSTGHLYGSNSKKKDDDDNNNNSKKGNTAPYDNRPSWITGRPAW